MGPPPSSLVSIRYNWSPRSVSQWFLFCQVNDLKGYVNNEVLSDVQFIVEGIPVHAHKVGVLQPSPHSPKIVIRLTMWLYVCFYCADTVSTVPVLQQLVDGRVHGEQVSMLHPDERRPTTWC
jgi:hypothetical protein